MPELDLTPEKEDVQLMASFTNGTQLDTVMLEALAGKDRRAYHIWTPIFVRLKTREVFYWITFFVICFISTNILMGAINSLQAEAESETSFFSTITHVSYIDATFSSSTDKILQ